MDYREQILEYGRICYEQDVTRADTPSNGFWFRQIKDGYLCGDKDIFIEVKDIEEVEELTEYKNFNTLFKFCYNQIDYGVFESIMEEAYSNTDSGYIKDKWDMFQDNMFSFLVQYRNFYLRTKEVIAELHYEG